MSESAQPEQVVYSLLMKADYMVLTAAEQYKEQTNGA